MIMNEPPHRRWLRRLSTLALATALSACTSSSVLSVRPDVDVGATTPPFRVPVCRRLCRRTR